MTRLQREQGLSDANLYRTEILRDIREAANMRVLKEILLIGLGTFLNKNMRCITPQLWQAMSSARSLLRHAASPPVRGRGLKRVETSIVHVTTYRRPPYGGVD